MLAIHMTIFVKIILVQDFIHGVTILLNYMILSVQRIGLIIFICVICKNLLLRLIVVSFIQNFHLYFFNYSIRSTIYPLISLKRSIVHVLLAKLRTFSFLWVLILVIISNCHLIFLFLL